MDTFYTVTVSPELMSLDDSLACHGKELDELGLYVKSSLLVDKTMLGQAPLHCFSEIKDYKVFNPANWVSKLNSSTGMGLYVGSLHTKTMSEMTNPPCKTITILGRSWGTIKLCCKKDVRRYDVVFLREFASTLKTNLSFQGY